MIGKVSDFKEIILWGIGSRGKDAYEYFLSIGITVIAAIDSDVNKQGLRWNGITVVSFDEYLSAYRGVPIVITPERHSSIEGIIRQLDEVQYYLLDDFMGLLYGNAVCGKETGDVFYHQAWCYRNLLEKYYKFRCSIGSFRNLEDPYKLLHGKNIGIQSGGPEINNVYNLIFDGKVFPLGYNSEIDKVDAVILHGLGFDYKNINIFLEAEMSSKPCYHVEDGFIRSICPFNESNVDMIYKQGHSISLDYNSVYINGKSTTYLESIINSERSLKKDELARAQAAISKILKNKLSKYNCQPEANLNIGHKAKKVLVIDQVRGDNSVQYGMADENTFSEMLEEAIRDNSDADIIVKTHPQRSMGYYSNVGDMKNVYYIDYQINPISLLQYVDIVYVCTSQMGFEACLCGKEVHVFGMPFYAGWGFTIDKQICKRRSRLRSIVEVFYFAYIVYSHYVSYETKAKCEIEQCLDEIIYLRKQFFEEISSEI